MTSTRPFRAFVSYCHEDAPFAAWLQRRLEGYRLPRRLADQVEPLPGQAPGRIGPVFRDRADLSAATDLSAAVREAIAASSALGGRGLAGRSQVAMGRRARSSLFRELHPDAPILVALARGEPHEALPEAVAPRSRAAGADFRKQGDGKRLAFLKIVAGLVRPSPRRPRPARRPAPGTARDGGHGWRRLCWWLVMALLLAWPSRRADARSSAERRRSAKRRGAGGIYAHGLARATERRRAAGDHGRGQPRAHGLLRGRRAI